MSDRTLKALVYAALARAKANGYDQVDVDPTQVAEDLLDYEQTLAAYTVDDVIDHVLSWQQLHRPQPEKDSPYTSTQAADEPPEADFYGY